MSENKFTKLLHYLSIWVFSFLVTLLMILPEAFAFEIDLSRRQRRMRTREANTESIQKNFDTLLLDLFTSKGPQQELVILNSSNGFIPSKVRLRKGTKYMVHIVNINSSEKNVSFILDAFSEHHATYFGKIKSFEIMPAQEGVYTYLCPETSAEGKLVVYAVGDSTGGKGK